MHLQRLQNGKAISGTVLEGKGGLSGVVVSGSMINGFNRYAFLGR